MTKKKRFAAILGLILPLCLLSAFAVKAAKRQK